MASCTEECEPNFAPEVDDQTFTIDETDTAGTSVGFVMADDQDSDELTYNFMLQTPSEAFTIDEFTGEIKVSQGANLDFDTQSSFSLIVVVSDGELESTAVVTVLINNVFTSQELTLRPGPTVGQDAIVYSFAPDKIYATYSQVLATAWTRDGSPTVQRSYIQFDLSSIPESAKIEKVYLSLYHYLDNNNDGHSQMDGSNAATIYRVTEAWDENQITWNTRASYTDENSVTLPASTSTEQNYTDIDITSLVVNNNDERYNNYGYMIMLDNESYYRSITFASSNVADENLRPKLVIQYEN
ncbi:MAG: DNRLRE domain-containing protein [Cyclobacteriaceae bacterium]